MTFDNNLRICTHCTHATLYAYDSCSYHINIFEYAIYIYT